ncbi:MAG: WXG100 family type VII secretion target [Bacilli bacterium]|nr:WXG100 family type VII secretion target [Bacilli bacterium]
MSDLNLNASPDQLRETASRIASLRGEAESTATNLDRQVDTIRSGWQGEASEAYTTKYTDLHKRLSNAVKNIEEIETALNRAAESLEQEENTMGREFGGE